MRLFFILNLLFFSVLAFSQDNSISLMNPSFEDDPQKGGDNYRLNLKGWRDCGEKNFPYETPPDIHPQDYWENRKQPSHGDTYLGMVVRDNDSWESVAQLLASPLEAEKCYSLSIDLSQSKSYVSKSRLMMQYQNSSEDLNYTTPTVLRIWGGNSVCETRQLLGESAPINHSEWKTYNFKLKPAFNFKYITLEAFYKTPVLFPYNGHILVDNCSDIVEISCEEDLAMVEETEVAEEDNLPPHKRVKKNKPSNNQSTTTSGPSANTNAKPKKILNLDRKNIVKGQVIEIQNLYFSADTSSINDESHEVLAEIYDFLKDNDDIIIEVGGHTNGTPPHDYCDKLSTERAKAVAEFLVEAGIDGDRIYYKGYGKRKPIASNFTESGRKKNQRVEIKILSME